MNKIDFDDEELFRRFFTLDDYVEERKLFWTINKLDPDFCKNQPFRTLIDSMCRKLFYHKNVNGNPWKTRLELWEEHIDRYLRIKDNLVEKKDIDVSADRIDRLNQILNILDSKIGMTLNSSSLLLAGVGFFVTLLPSLTNWMSPSWVGSTLLIVIYLLIFFVVFLCLFTIWFSLRGFRRVVWGDLGLSKQVGNAARESEYAAYLILSVARRTNMFRAAAVLIRRAVFCLFLFAGLAGGLLIARTINELRHGAKASSAVSAGNVTKSGEGTRPVEMDRSTIVMPGGIFSISNTELPKVKPKPGNGTGGKEPKPRKKPDCCQCCGKKSQ